MKCDYTFCKCEYCINEKLIDNVRNVLKYKLILKNKNISDVF